MDINQTLLEMICNRLRGQVKWSGGQVYVVFADYFSFCYIQQSILRLVIKSKSRTCSILRLYQIFVLYTDNILE